MTAPALPGATLGVLGGGQLGRMFALAAHRMGYLVAIYAEEAEPPAGLAVHRHVRASYQDLDSVAAFAREVDVLTFEFENVPVAAADAAARWAPIRPAGALLHTTQNRLREKSALRSLGLPVADFAAVEDESTLTAARRAVPGAGVLKTAAWGYDGKGQRCVVANDDLVAAWRDLGGGPAVFEAWVPFEREISVVGTRGIDGQIALYEPFENAHADHILDVAVFPARIDRRTRDAALEMARTVLEGLGVVGVLCVEMFAVAGGDLLVNEIAPRPHNSGHVTIDAHVTSQFEQQVRAVCGLPLGSVEPVVPAAAMANLLGDLWSAAAPDWSRVLEQPGLHLHLYGKGRPAPGRKMGHLTAAGHDREEAERLVREGRERLAPSSNHAPRRKVIGVDGPSPVG